MAMIDVPVFDMKGASLGSEQIDEALLGGHVRYPLLKDAVVAFEASQRQGTVQTKTRAMVHGASRKLYRQKGTGRARAGNIRTPVRRGGGHTFAKINRDFTRSLPRRMRRLARNSAILAKLKSGSALIVDSIQFDAPKTKAFAGMLSAVGIKGTCLVTLSERDENAWKSGRNIPGVNVLPLEALNAYHVLQPGRVVFSRDAFTRLKSELENKGGADQAE
jgi:large subunit ribosomal protein L4